MYFFQRPSICGTKSRNFSRNKLPCRCVLIKEMKLKKNNRILLAFLLVSITCGSAFAQNKSKPLTARETFAALWTPLSEAVPPKRPVWLKSDDYEKES